MFYACFMLIGSWEGDKNFRIGIFLNKNLLGLTGNKQLFFKPNINPKHYQLMAFKVATGLTRRMLRLLSSKAQGRKDI